MDNETAEEEVKEGCLRAWHIQKIPDERFYVRVSSPQEAVKILNILRDYDDFLWQVGMMENVYFASGLDVFQNGEWVEVLNEKVVNRDLWEALQRLDGKE